MSFKKINNIAGWAIFFIACITYVATSEAGGSFWDCGEFVSTAYKLQIPHPPGAPLFVLLGRFFIILFGDDPMNAAKAVNIMNALASAFTVLFLFWTITHFARRIINGNKPFEEMNSNQIWTIMAAGAIGALAFTFSDSFWYSAVEGEVYALSSFFTAITFWAILRWEHMADKPGADKWIVFIFFLIGLAIGVHLLNLLTIPAIILVIYFRRREEFDYKLIKKWFLRLMVAAGVVGFIAALIGAPASEYIGSEAVGTDATPAGLILFLVAAAIGILFLVEKWSKDNKALWGGAYIFLVLSAAILGVAQVGLIQYSIKAAGAMDRLFVNGLGMPFFSGFAFFFLLVAVVLYFGIRYAGRKGYKYFSLSLWSITFVLIGYSTYVTTLIRSNANPSIDMFNVDNPMSLVGYLGREQYGDFPLLYGQKFTSGAPTYVDVGKSYAKSTDIDPNAKREYIVTGNKSKGMYSKDEKMAFPRVWNNGSDRGQADYYAAFLGIGKFQDPQTGQTHWEREPNFIDNIKFYIGYQNYYMFLRYFLWNYSGRQNDLQGNGGGDVRGGNWITGISFIDNMMYGDQSAMPDSLKNNKARNTFFLLPLILGLIGMFFHFKTKKEDALITFMLFFMTGFAIIIYLNQAGNEPRERDYAFAGATYAFAIWIGLGLLKVREWFQKINNKNVATSLSFVVCLLAVPVLMAQQGWDDHDRSKKTLAPDLAVNYLESCAPNAIIFSFGDNDTYPLWYAQEVLGVRPDIRVVNTSLLGIDWYINGLRSKVNESAPIDVIFSRSQMEGDKRNVVYYSPNPAFPEDRYYNLYEMMKDYVGVDNPATMVTAQDGSAFNTFPVKKVFVPVDEAAVRANGTVNAGDTVLSQLQFDIPKNYLAKNDWAQLNIIAANQWKRPIYFTNASTFQIGLGFEKYLRKEGMAYRLAPVEPKNVEFGEQINAEKGYPIVMNKFKFGNADLPGVYFDEENRRHLISIRSAAAQLALELANEGKKEEARNVLQKTDRSMLQENVPYGMVSTNNMHNRASFNMLQAALLAEDKQLFNKIAASLKKDFTQQINYVNKLGTDKVGPYVSNDAAVSQQLLDGIAQMEQMLNQPMTMSTENTNRLDSAGDSVR